MSAESLSPLLSAEHEQRVRAVLTDLTTRGWSLGTAESCTGGLLAALFTDVPGTGRAFRLGVVAYTDEVKASVLGVDPSLLEADGAVCAPVATAMAEGLLHRHGCDVGVSTTGYADVGPEPGLVYIALAQAGADTVCREHRFGGVGRGPFRRRTLEAVIALLDERLAPPPEGTG